MNAFRLKYNALPGDTEYAASYWPGITEGGDGDNRISTAKTEGLRAWQHLYLAKMLPDAYSGKLDDRALAANNQPFDFKDMLIGSAYASNGQDKFDVCHNGHTINIAEPAVRVHLNHGDTMGSCDDNEESDDDGDEHCESEHHNDSDHDDDCDDDSDDEHGDCEHHDDGDHNEDCNDDDGGDGGHGEDGDDDGDSDDDGGNGDDGDDNDDGGNGEEEPKGKFTIGFNIPASEARNGGYRVDWTNTPINGHLGNHITLAAERDPNLDGSILTPDEAKVVDSKLDDGEPTTGHVMSEDGNGDTGCVISGQYDLTNNSTNKCQMHFFLD